MVRLFLPLIKAAARKFDSLNPLAVKSICFCTSRLSARLPARIAALGKSCCVFNTVALFHFLFYVHDGFPNSFVRALLSSARTPHRPFPPPPPDADADADADEAVTDALFFSPFLPVAFLPAPFSGSRC